MQNGLGTKTEARLSFSDDGTLCLTAPRAWCELQRGEAGYVLQLMAAGRTSAELKVMMLLRFTGIHIEKRDRYGFRCYAYRRSGGGKRHFRLQPWQVESLSRQFDWVDRYEDYDVRLDSVCGHSPVNASLHGYPFGHYLNAEKYYQGYLRSRNGGLLDRLGQLLYPDKDGNMDKDMTLRPWERLHVFLWFQHVKGEFSKFFPNFFKPSAVTSGPVTEYDVVRAMNVQIRALTDGDITKERQVLEMDCWRALTELDAKARDAAELRKKTKNHV